MPGPDELLFGPADVFGGDQTTIDWGTSQILPASIDDRHEPQTLELDDVDLGLDLGEDLTTPGPQDRSIEVGRRAETARPDRPGETTLFEDDLGLDLGLDDPAPLPPMDDITMPQMDDDFAMGAVNDLGLDIDETNRSALLRAEQRRRERESLSPLSELAPEEERDLERTFQLEHPEEDETQIQAQQRVKRRKVLQMDVNTELHNSQIRAQQEDHSKILKQPTFLPRDPMLLALMNMQKSGGFVSSILGDGRSIGWAPELRGILSLEVVRRAGDLKRKRDSGVPQLEIPAEEEEDLPAGAEPSALEQSADLAGDDFDIGLPPSDGAAPLTAADTPGAAEDIEEPYIASPGGPAFDETTIPGVHPADSGPVSLATKHAVHMLREHFSTTATGEPPSPSTRASQSVSFTDLCPEARTSREDATKLFFETLVLGTKDAIKVEQSSDVLGGPIRIRGKRGLWGDWAEMGVSQSQGVLGTQAGAVDDDGIEV